jgi:signal transduction histidine kinase
MPNGGRLTVCVAEEEGEWRVSFADMGRGIPAAQLEKIFEPFQSGTKSGTGLGLAIVYQILQAHDVKIQVRSELEKGTEFVISFPPSQREAKPEPLASATAGGARG